MYCKHCNVTVKGSVHRCPLCGKALSADKDADDRDEFVLGKDRAPVNATLLFKQIYSYMSLFLLLTSIILNIFVFPTHVWSVLVGAVLLYVYILVNNLFITYYSIAYLTVIQSITISLLCILIQYIFHIPRMAVNYAIPIISMVSSLVLGIVSLIKPQKAKQYLLDYLALGLLGIAPWLISRLSPAATGLLPKVSACVGGVMLICLLSFSLRDVAKELDRFFHS